MDQYASYKNLTLTISNDLNQIESNVYTIKREENLSYIYGTSANTTIEEYLEKFKNNLEELHIYDLNNNEIIDKSKYITTKMKIKLIKNNETKDELNIVVKGDINCDGDITVGDMAKMKAVTMKIVALYEIEQIAGDITENDRLITMTDLMKITRYLSMEIDNLN